MASVRCQQQLRDAHDGPTHHYLTLLSTGHPAKEKCAPVAKSISGPSSQIPIPGLFYARQSGNSTRFEVFKRVIRLASVVLPRRQSGTDFFGNESSEIEKSTDFGGGRVRLSRTTEMLFGVWRTKRFGQRQISRSFRETADFPNSSRPIFAMALNTKATHMWRGYFTDKIRVDTRVPVWNTWV